MLKEGRFHVFVEDEQYRRCKVKPGLHADNRCGEPAVGVVRWLGSGYAVEVCQNHYNKFACAGEAIPEQLGFERGDFIRRYPHLFDEDTIRKYAAAKNTEQTEGEL